MLQVLKIQPQTFKSSYIKLIALLCSLAFSTLLAIFLTAINTPRYTASLSVFIIFGVVYLIAAIVYVVVHNVRKDCKCLKVVWLVDIAYFIGGLLYYVGRNIPILIILKINPCDITCQQSLQVVESILLGMVVVLYRFIPFFISKYYQSNLAKEHQTTEVKLQLVPEWILAAESLTLLVEFDALYTVMLHSFFQV